MRNGDRRLTNPSILNQYSRPKVVVRRAADQSARTNELPIEFDIVFDKPVIDFPTGHNTGGIVFTGSSSGLRYEVTGERAAYRVIIRAVAEDGDITLAVPAELAVDLFGNVNTASTDEGARVELDLTRPQSVIQSDVEGVMNDAQMRIALVFSEPVFGLRDDALTLENASVERVSGADGDTRYDFVVTPRADGTTALTLPDDAVVDAVGNGNAASPVFSLVVDSTGPAVALSSFETPQASNSWVMRVHATFNEPVYEFERSDVLVRGGELMNFSRRDDGMTYLFDVRPLEGTVRLSIPEGVARDAIGNPNDASDVFEREIDRSRPSVEISVALDEASSGQPVPVDVLFSEPVFGFEPGDLKISYGVAQRIAGQEGDSRYRYLVAPTGRRNVELKILSGVAVDLAGNENKSGTARFSPSALPITSPNADEAGRDAPPLLVP